MLPMHLLLHQQILDAEAPLREGRVRDARQGPVVPLPLRRRRPRRARRPVLRPRPA